MRSFRVVTYNVRRFSHGKDKTDVVEAALARLLPLQPLTLLALNEVDVSLRLSALQRLSSALALPHVEFFGHVRGAFGNALLSSEPLTDVENVNLDGGSVVSFNGKEHLIQRGLLVASVTLSNEPVRVGVTHLDHMDEVHRATQAKHVARTLSKPLRTPSHTMLLGDLNALRISDYTAEQWAVHCEHNAQRGWAPPRDSDAGGALGMLRDAGFTDCVRDSLGVREERRRMADHSSYSSPTRWVSPPWSAHVHTAGSPRYRIDYVLWRTKMDVAATSRISCTGARVENAVDDGGHSSDHVPVAVDFAIV